MWCFGLQGAALERVVEPEKEPWRLLVGSRQDNY